MSAHASRRLVWVAVLLAAARMACRGDVDPFQSEDRRPFAEGRQTFSPGDDRSPAWSADGQSILYSAERSGNLAASPGVLMSLPLEGGPAEVLLPNVQSADVRANRWLVTPAAEPAGQRVALVEIQKLWDPHPCDLGLTVLTCTPERTPAQARRPPLRLIAVRVRQPDASGPLEDDPTLMVEVPGVIREGVGVTTDRVNDYPFQQLFAQEQAFTFRASWAPDGGRIALSDGLRILLWNVRDPTADTVPNTEDGAWPAWSPDGQLIAFTRLEREDSTNVSCDYAGGFGTVCIQLRTEYIPGPRILTLIRPDGSGVTELGEGDEPAWAPDGSLIFFRRAGQIWRMTPDGTSAEAIPGTDGGREPAVSPDGRLLAFAKLSPNGDYDIWVTRLKP